MSTVNKTTSRPKGLTLERKGGKFTLSWKISSANYDDGQDLQYVIITSQKKFDSAENFMKQGFKVSGLKWKNVGVGKKTTAKAISITLGDYYPNKGADDKYKPYLAGIIFRVRGNRKDETKTVKGKRVTYKYSVSDWSYYYYDTLPPEVPEFLKELSDQSNYVTYSWECNDATLQRINTDVEFETIAVKNTTGAYKTDDFWTDATKETKEQAGSYVGGGPSGEDFDISTDSWTRFVRVRARGAGGASDWVYLYNVFALPYAAKNVAAEAIKDEATNTFTCNVNWLADADFAHPIDNVLVEYAMETPLAGMQCPAEANWQTGDTRSDTTGSDRSTFSIDGLLGEDKCLFIRIVTEHKSTTNGNYASRSIPIIATRDGTGLLKDPEITALESYTDGNYKKVRITASNESDVPDARIIVSYKDKVNQEPIDIGVATNDTETVLYVPDWTGKEPKDFGVRAVVGTIDTKVRQGDNVSVVTVRNEIMRSSGIIWDNGTVPRAPENVSAVQTVDNDILVTWDWAWDEADSAEVSWADRENAWDSTDEPDTHIVSKARSSKLYISGLDTGQRYYVRVRLIKGSDDSAVYGEYSETQWVDLNSAPAIPELTLTPEVVTENSSFIASWSYVSTDGTDQDYAAISEVTRSGGEYHYSDPIAEVTDAQRISISSSRWPVGTEHALAVRVRSKSGRWSEWSTPKNITVAEPISCEIVSTSLESKEIELDPETKSGSLVTLDGGDDTNVRDVTSLQVTLEPVQAGTPAQGSEASDAYLMKASPTTDFNSEYLTVVGGTVAWNQLAKDGNFTGITANRGWQINGNYGTLTYANNVGSYTVDVVGTAGYHNSINNVFNDHAPIVLNHKYLCRAEINPAHNKTGSTGVGMWLNRLNNTVEGTNAGKTGFQLQAGGWNTIEAIIVSASTKGYMQVSFDCRATYGYEVGDVDQVRNVMCIDLTQMFGSTIADYIYSLETANAGAGVAWFRKLFPKGYYAYNAGELISVKTSAHVTAGKNLLQNTATNTTVANVAYTIGSDGSIKANGTSNAWTPLQVGTAVLPAGEYVLSTGITSNNLYLEFVLNGSQVNNASVAEKFFTVSESTTVTVNLYARPNINQGNVTVHPMICSSLHSNRTYEKYEERHTYALDSDLELRGIPKLTSGNLYYDGDTYESNGKVTRRYGIVIIDGSTAVASSYNNSGNTAIVVQYTASGIKQPSDGLTTPLWLINSYGLEIETPNRQYANNFDCISVPHNTANRITLAFKDVTTVEAVKQKLTAKPLTIVYELATSTTETADAFTSPQTAYPYGTESFTDTRAVPIPVGTTHRYASVYPISGHDEVTVTRTSEQLYDPENVEIGKNWIMDSDPLRAINVFNVTGGESCRIITSGGNFDNVLFIEMNNNTQITNFSVKAPYDNTVTLDPACNKIIMQFQQTTTITEDNFNGFTCSVSKEYETYTTDLGRTVYGGTYNVVTGELTVDKVYYTVNGSETWRIATGDPLTYFYLNDTTLANDTRPEIKCDAFTPITNGPDGHTAGTTWLIYRQIHIHPTDDIAPSGLTTEGIAELKAWLQAHPVHYVLPLSTPVKYNLTPQTVTLSSGTNNVWSEQGDVTIRTVDAVTTGLALTRMPLTVNITGAGQNGVVNVLLRRTESYVNSLPNGDDLRGYAGEVVARVDSIGDGEVEIPLERISGRLDDGAKYQIEATIQDNLNQKAEAVAVPFFVKWDDQAIMPEASVDIEDGVAKITIAEMRDASEGAYCDIYRLSVDKPELIYHRADFNNTYVDPYPTIGEFGGYRVVYYTANGDYITADDTYAWEDYTEEEYESDEAIIDFNGEQLRLYYNVDADSSWAKDFKQTKYLGGAVQGDWKAGVSRTGTAAAVFISVTEADKFPKIRELAEWLGHCHVRTLDGSSYTADVQVSESNPHDKHGLVKSASLSITRIDPVDVDGMTLAEWEKNNVVE